MSKILFDLTKTQPSSEGMRHGGGKYGEIVLKRIIERKMPISCFYNSKSWMNPEMKQIMVDNNIEVFDLAEKNLEEIIADSEINFIFVPAAFNGNYWSGIDVNVLGVIHGLRGLETPLDSGIFMYKLSLKDYIREIVKRISKNVRRNRQKAYILASLSSKNIKIITVSHHSSNSFRCFFPELNPSVPVFYSPSHSVINTKERKYEKNYFLLVSANRPIKNNLRAIMAFDKLFSNGLADNYRVKVTGIVDESKFWYKIKNRDRFDLLGYVDDKELDQLYHDAYCFVYPTLNEGFGAPPLEAMHYGVPVLTTAFSAVPEICQGNVIYFNPFSIEEIMNRILMITDPKVYEEYSTKAYNRFCEITQIQNEELDKLIDYMYSEDLFPL